MNKQNIIIDGNNVCRSYVDLLKSRTFKKVLKDFLGEKVERDPKLKRFTALFKKTDDIINLLLLLTHHRHDEISETNYGVFCKYIKNPKAFYYFLEKLYHFWRSYNRYMIKREKFSSSAAKRLPKKFVSARDMDNLRFLILETFRTIAFNGSGLQNYIFRQTSAGPEVALLTDYLRIPEKHKLPFDIYDTPAVWTAVLEQPLIYYTGKNTRSGIMKVNDKDYLAKYGVPKKDFLLFPIYSGTILIFVYVHKNFLHLGASLANLFEFADFNAVKRKKPEGILVFGADPDFFAPDETAGLVKIYEKLDIVVGAVGNFEEVDYFGYMKKSILTIHNIIQMRAGNLPIHGAMARITLKNGAAANIMFVGDSGAGKSETLSALTRNSEVKFIRIIIDDMGTVKIQNDRPIAYGTEIGAFIRMDDLESGFAFSELDRSIFINPNKKNARVIIPFADYTEIIEGLHIDALFYANNYEPVRSSADALSLSDEVESGLKVFREGKRMAKGTTSEKGLASSYFGNPFGAVQLTDLHKNIEDKIFPFFTKNSVPVGVLRTQLGIPGMEFKGPEIAAEALLKFIKTIPTKK